MKYFIAVFAALVGGSLSGTLPLMGDEVTPAPPTRCERIIQTCVTPLIANSTGTGNTPPVLWTPSVLSKQCRLMRTAGSCMTLRGVETCPEDALSGWTNMANLMNFLCHDVYDELVNVSSCVNSPRTQSDLHRCIGILARGQHAMINNPSSMTDLERCRLIEMYESCVIQVDGTDCGTQARDLYMRIFQKVNSIMGSELDCPSEEGNGDENDVPPQEAVPVPENGQEGRDDGLVEDDSRCEMIIGKCLSPLEPHRKGFTSFQLETIPQLCADFGLVQKCLDSSAADCKSTQEWTILENALEQICETAEKFYAMNSCEKGNMATQLRSCEREELKGDTEIEDSRVCTVIEEYVNCYTVTVERKCGSVHGRVVNEVMTGVAQAIQLEKDVVCEASMEENDADLEKEDEIELPKEEPSTESFRTTFLTTTSAPLVDESPVFDSWGPLKKCMGRSAALLMNPLPTHTHHSFEDLCADSLRAVQCERIYDHVISGDVKALWEDFMTAVNYMCVEKRSEFASLYSCMSRLSSPLQHCYPTEADADIDTKEICRLVDTMEDCTVGVVRGNCGKEAGNLMRDFMKKMNKVLSKQMDIDCSWVSRNHLLIGLAAGGALLLLCLIISICVVVRRRSRRSASEDKKDLVKNDILQANLKLTVENEKEKDIEVLSVISPKV